MGDFLHVSLSKINFFLFGLKQQKVGKRKTNDIPGILAS